MDTNLLRVRSIAWVAQSVEQRTENPCVGGSIPSPGTILNLRFLLFYGSKYFNNKN